MNDVEPAVAFGPFIFHSGSRPQTEIAKPISGKRPEKGRGGWAAPASSASPEISSRRCSSLEHDRGQDVPQGQACAVCPHDATSAAKTLLETRTLEKWFCVRSGWKAR